MKKFLIYSSAITGGVVIIGLLFVYGVFNFSEGKSELIGPSVHGSAEIDLHNNIVEKVHEIGNLTREAVLNTPEDVDYYKYVVNEVGDGKDELVSLIEQNTFTNKQEKIKDAFYESYLPALNDWHYKYSEPLNMRLDPQLAAEDAAEIAEEDTATETGIVELTEEDIASFRESLNNAQGAYIEAHNSFVDVLNSVRRY